MNLSLMAAICSIWKVVLYTDGVASIDPLFPQCVYTEAGAKQTATRADELHQKYGTGIMPGKQYEYVAEPCEPDLS